MMTFARRLAQTALLASILGTLGGCEIITNVDRSLLIDAGSGAGTTTTTTTKTGTGGSSADGGTPCTVATDCPGSDTECQSRTCTSGECGVAYQPDGTALKAQPTGTCQKNVCDGKGGTTSIADDSNLPVNNLQCTDHKCTSGVPSTPAFAAGTTCTQNGGKVCDGNGQCVACVQASDCSGGGVCSQHMCVAATCADGVKDGTETDVDCGGSCGPCASGKGCGVPGDCTSGVCTASVCAAPTCSDGVKNGAETDVDCGGGTCGTCATGKACLLDGDCTTNACDATALTCVASQCTDHQKDGAETDVDCGGGTCGTCGVGKHCAGNGDCASALCISSTCAAGPTCSDGTLDGNETDVDCGGSCSTCATGKKCLVDGDCSSTACDAVSLLCVASQCGDHQKDGNETDVDCGGGGTCSTCATGKKCLVNGDCATSACDATNHVCDASQCADGQQDGNETDVDCGGGGTCSTCATGKKCLVNGDCATGACDANGLTCVASQCSDHQKDGAETDVDCGGGTCGTCAVGKKCVGNGDCTSAACVSGTCAAGPTCSDGIQDGNESDADCGGSCTPCATGKKCLGDGDCATSACDVVSLLCVASPCGDHQQDGTETDVDCGGSCTACATGKKCLVDGDCATSACDATNHVCDASQCADGQKDGTETDVDCGGSCTACATGKKCLVNGDCATSACDAANHVCDASQCADGHQDGTETDVDCGGSCTTCANGKKCLVDGDCASGGCDATNHVCDVSPCTDGQKDGTETDVDCGGSCTPCANGKKCLVDSDCASGGCDAINHVCDASQCADGQKDGHETDVDCGGGTCLACVDGKACAVNGDCQNLGCVSLVCQTPTCSDLTQDGTETGVDCGGGSCPTCANGQGCAGASDCQSGSCSGNVCTACSSDANCGGATPACNTTTGVCQQCSATNNSLCSDPTAVCDATIGTCVQCTQLSQCTTPPASTFGCADATHLWAPSCAADACSYATGSSCPDGCWQNVCNTTGPSFDGDATASIGTLDKELSLDPSSGTEAANTPVPVTVLLKPHNTAASVTLTYTTDDFATTTPITCTRSGTSGNDDVWTATVPGQAAGLTVRFYYQALDYSSNAIYLPGSNINYTYVTQ